MRIVLRIGGSVIASPIDPDLIGKYIDLLKNLRSRGHEVAVVVGGGALARELIQAAKAIGLTERDQDDVAISVSRLFAQLFLKKLSRLGPKEPPSTAKEAAHHLRKGKIVIMGGMKPGMTTDTVAAIVAERVNADLYVKATDQEGIYNKDPKKYADAVRIKHLSFDDLPRVLSESKHRAGIHQILDPEAVKRLRTGKVKVVIVNGFKPEIVLLAVEGKSIGTVID